MFGLENQKKKKGAKAEPFVFDLENELLSGKAYKEMKAKIEDRIQKIKELLRSGDNQQDFDQLGILLHGYTSLQKVFARLAPKT